eukprot:TRINITY_DN14382_c0_g1_i1.p1 TRINITY_DN14382_c0_g1~~TRINITY_DN14382_c0_g1_i1.p1  ORF type:complete len:537 (+),score=67.68 TRINITY_DN14382_c0_g1_i1:72-1682(+)
MPILSVLLLGALSVSAEAITNSSPAVYADAQQRLHLTGSDILVNNISFNLVHNTITALNQTVVQQQSAIFDGQETIRRLRAQLEQLKKASTTTPTTIARTSISAATATPSSSTNDIADVQSSTIQPTTSVFRFADLGSNPRFVVPPNSSFGFGTAMAVHNDLLAVTGGIGSPGLGSVFVFKRAMGNDAPASGFALNQTLSISATLPSSSKLAFCDDGTLVVGGVVGSSNTEVWIYSLRSNGRYEAPAFKFESPIRETRDGFGTALATSGTTIAVGAPNARGGRFGRARGRVFIYARDANGRYNQSQELTLDDHNFGESIAMQGSTLVIATPLFRRVDIYELNSTGQYSHIQTLTSSDNRHADKVVLQNDILLVAVGGIYASFLDWLVYEKNQTGLFSNVSSIISPYPNDDLVQAYQDARDDDDYDYYLYQEESTHRSVESFNMVFLAPDVVAYSLLSDETLPNSTHFGKVLLYERSASGMFVRRSSITALPSKRNEFYGYATLVGDGFFAVSRPVGQYQRAGVSEVYVYFYNADAA